ncbi:hypothetical protein Tco_0975807 [Tanacetum coccineum]|uniref:Uncharacterized protein n=1 Tax=Tanacetum coccineum TaxID=301880 RepID=A0ABQ5EFG1_9ASTR
MVRVMTKALIGVVDLCLSGLIRHLQKHCLFPVPGISEGATSGKVLWLLDVSPGINIDLEFYYANCEGRPGRSSGKTFGNSLTTGCFQCWPFVFAVPSQMTHLVASLTLDSARSCVMQLHFLATGVSPCLMFLLVLSIFAMVAACTSRAVETLSATSSSRTGSLSSGHGIIHNELSNSSEIDSSKG